MFLLEYVTPSAILLKSKVQLIDKTELQSRHKLKYVKSVFSKLVGARVCKNENKT